MPLEVAMLEEQAESTLEHASPKERRNEGSQVLSREVAEPGHEEEDLPIAAAQAEPGSREGRAKESLCHR